MQNLIVPDTGDAPANGSRELVVPDTSYTDVLREKYSAQRIDPDAYTKARQLSQKTGLPAETAHNNLPEAEYLAKQPDWASVNQASKALTRRLAEDDAFFNSAKDDTENLSTVERVIGTLAKIPAAMKSGYFRADAGFAGVLAAGADVVALGTEAALTADAYASAALNSAFGIGRPMSDARTVDSVTRGAAGWLRGYSDASAATADAARPKTSGNIEGGFVSGIESLTTNLMAMPLAFLPGGQGAALGMMTAPVAGNAYMDADNAGLPLDQRLAYAGTQGGLEYAFERAPFLALFKDLKAGTPFFELLMKQIAMEVPAEIATTITQKISETVTLHPDKTFDQFMSELPDDVAQTVVATLVGTGGQVTVMRAADEAVKRIRARAGEAKQAESSGATLAESAALAAAGKLAQRDPEAFQSFVEEANAEGVQDLYVSAKVLMQSGYAKELADISPAVAEQVETALAIGGEVRISVAEFIAKVGPNQPMSAALLDDVRFDGQEFTPREAREYLDTQTEQMRAEYEKIVAAQSSDAEKVASREKVRERMLADLNALGNFKPQFNEAYAGLYAAHVESRAERMGTTAEAWDQQYGVKMGRGVVGRVDDRVLNQGGGQRTGSIDESTGLPLNDDGTVTVYHHTSAENAVRIRKDGVLRSAGEPDLYFTTTAETDTGYGDTAIPIRVKPDRLQLDDEFEGGRQDFRVDAPGRSRRLRFLQDGSARLFQSGDDTETVQQFRDAEKAYGGKPAYEKAKAEGRTKLTYHQWVQVRTPNFLRWFGNWLGENQRIAPIELTLEGWDGGTTALSALARDVYTKELQKNEVENASLDAQIAFTSEGKNEAFGARGKMRNPVRAELVRVLRDVTRSAVKVAEEAPGKGREGDSRAFHTLVAPLRVNGELHSVKVTVREALHDPSGKPHKFYDVTSVQIERSPGVHGLDAVETAVHPAPSEASGISVAELAAAFNLKVSANPATVSKVIDPTTGEPMVVYHGTKDSFDEFKDVDGKIDGGFLGRGFYFATEPELSNTYANTKAGAHAPNVMPVFVSIRNPLQLALPRNKTKIQLVRDAVGLPYGKANENVTKESAREVTESASAMGFDGVRLGYSRGGQEIVAFQPTQIKSATGNNGEFNPENTNILRQGNEGPRGFYDPEANTIALLKSANFSTFLHEAGHFFFESDIRIASELVAAGRELTDGEQSILNDVSALLTWHGIKAPTLREQLTEWHRLPFEEKRAHHERTAESFEAYLFSGKAPSMELHGYFQSFRNWLLRTYDSLKAFLKKNPEAGKLSPEVRAIFDRMLATDAQIALAEQGRSMMPLFTSQEQAKKLGVNIENFSAYQANAASATDDAKADLQAKGLRDLAWTRTAHTKAVKKLQQEAKERRAEIRMEESRAVMSQPVYRAWAFLTGKIEREAKAADTALRDAIAAWTQDKSAAESTARKAAEQEIWQDSPEGRKEYRKAGNREAARTKVIKANQREIDNLTEKALIEWERDHPKPAKPRKQVARDSGLNPSVDSLLVAVAKMGGLDAKQAIDQFGLDPEDFASSPVFGKPVLRKSGGMAPDHAAEVLAEFGYLPPREGGRYDLHDLGQFLHDEAAGTQHFSIERDYSIGEIETQPVPNLDEQPFASGRLSRAALEDMGFEPRIVDRLTALRMVANEGMHPELVAGAFDFENGADMVFALVAAQPPKVEIEARTDARMLAEHGELATPEAIKREADKAVHNEARARMVAAEANALAKAAGQRGVLAKAAKAFAAQMISGLRIRDIRPSQYAQAEVRAAKAAAKSAAAGKFSEAAAEKRNQLVNQYATHAAYDAQDEVTAGARYLKKFGSERTRKNLDPEYIEQIDVLLESFDLRAGQSNKAIDKRASLAEFAKRQEEMGLPVSFDADTLAAAQRTHYKSLTLEDFRGLVDAVKNIEHLGRLKHRLLLAKDQREFAAVVDELAATIRVSKKPGRAPALSPEGDNKLLGWLDGFAAEHRKMASLLRQMDSGKDGGPLWENVLRHMNAASDLEVNLNMQATQRLTEIFKPLLKMPGGLSGGKVTIEGVGTTTRAERMAIILNWGNPVNRQRLLDGRPGWNASTIQKVMAEMTPAELRAINEVWEYLDSFWPQVAAKEKRVSGKVPEKVEASPFEIRLKDGATVQMRGGYYPLKYDKRLDTGTKKRELANVAEESKLGAFVRAVTRRGHTKQRADEVRKPVLLSLSVIDGHIMQVTHDLAWHEWLSDTNRLLSAPAIESAIKEHYGDAVLDVLTQSLTDIATGNLQERTWLDGWLSGLRANIARSTMGFSVTTALLQPYGITQSVSRIGLKWVLKGAGRWAGSPKQMMATMEWIAEKSVFMKHRNTTFNRELHEIRNRVVNGQSNIKRMYDAAAFMLMQKMQLIADVPTWMGAYEKAKADPINMNDDGTLDEERVIALADQAVRDAQGGGQISDLSVLQKTHPLMTMFYSYFNTTLNLVAESTGKTNFREPLAVWGWTVDMFLLLVIPSILPNLMLMMLRGEEDDDEPMWETLLKWQASFVFGTVVGLREVSGMLSGYSYAGPPVGRVVVDMQRLSKQDDLDEAGMIASVKLLGSVTGIPSTQIVRSYRGAVAWADGEANPGAVLLGPPAK